jgi:hypothetical protein
VLSVKPSLNYPFLYCVCAGVRVKILPAPRGVPTRAPTVLMLSMRQAVFLKLSVVLTSLLSKEEGEIHKHVLQRKLKTSRVVDVNVNCSTWLDLVRRGSTWLDLA